jgi:chromosome segregation ATPase
MKQRLKRQVRRVATTVAPGLVASVDRQRDEARSRREQVDNHQQQLEVQQRRIEAQQHRLDTQRQQVERLRSRIATLEGEVHECRILNRRIAELTDIVQELVVPAARRDEAKLEQALRQYADRL